MMKTEERSAAGEQSSQGIVRFKVIERPFAILGHGVIISMPWREHAPPSPNPVGAKAGSKLVTETGTYDVRKVVVGRVHDNPEVGWYVNFFLDYEVGRDVCKPEEWVFFIA